MPVNLLDYQGNAGLGFGSNDIPITTEENAGLAALRGTTRDIMLNNNRTNILKWQQKLDDRDKLNQLIAQDQVPAGEIEEKDRPYFDAAKKATEKAYEQWGGNFQNTDGFEKYKRALQDWKDVANHARARQIGFSQLRQDRAKATLPERQQEMDSFYKKQQEKPFYSQVDPYQQTYDFHLDHILALPKPVTTTVQDKNDPAVSEEVSTYSYPQTLREAQGGWLNNADLANSINEFQDQFQRYDPQKRAEAVEGINSQLEKYNQQTGLQTIGRPYQEGDKEYAPPVKAGLVNGQLVIQDPVQEFAAKYALSDRDSFITRTPKFNKDIANLEFKDKQLQQKALNDAAKLGLDRYKAKAYVRNLDARTKKLSETLTNDADITNMWNGILGAVKPLGISTTETTKVYKNGKLVSETPTGTGSVGAIFTDEIPANADLVAGPTVNEKGKIIPGKLTPFKSKEGKSYFVPEYIDASTGKKVKYDINEIKTNFEKAKKDGTFRGTLDQFSNAVDANLKSGLKDGTYRLMMKGQNGFADYSTALQNARLINAQATTPKEEGVYEPIPESQQQYSAEQTTDSE